MTSSNPLMSAAAPTTDANGYPLPQPGQNTGGFWNILRNRVLPAVGSIASAIGAAYKNPGGEQTEQMYRDIARQRQFDQPNLALQQEQINEIPIRQQILQSQAADAEIQRQIHERQLATTPSTPQELENYLRFQYGLQASTRPPIPGVDANGNTVMMKPDPSDPTNYIPVTTSTPGSVSPTSAGPTQAPGTANATGITQGDNTTGDALGQGKSYIPGPIAAATAPTSGATPPPPALLGTTDTTTTTMQPAPGTSQGVRRPLMVAPKSPFEAFRQGELSHGVTDERQIANDYNTHITSGLRPMVQTNADGSQTLTWVPVTSTTTRAGGVAGGVAGAGNGPQSPGGVSGPPGPPAAPATSATPVKPSAMSTAPSGPVRTRTVAPASEANPPANAGPSQAPIPVGRVTAPSSAPVAGAGASIPFGRRAAPTVVQTAAENYIAARGRQTTMHQNLNDILNAPAGQPNQQAMLSLVANHIGMTLGVQKGSRVGQAQWAEAIASTPWLQGLTAKMFDTDPATGDLIFDPKGGVVITPAQAKQMVELGDQMVDRMFTQWQQTVAAAKSGFGMSGPLIPPASPNPDVNSLIQKYGGTRSPAQSQSQSQ